MLKITNKDTNKIVATGTLIGIEKTTIILDDEKEGEFKLSLDLLTQFVGKVIKITIDNTEEI